MQPPPIKTDSPEVWPLIIEELKLTLWGDKQARMVAVCSARDAFGRQKYGVALQVENGRNPLADALDETLDFMAYARQHYERVKMGGNEFAADCAWHVYETAVNAALQVLEEMDRTQEGRR